VVKSKRVSQNQKKQELFQDAVSDFNLIPGL